MKNIILGRTYFGLSVSYEICRKKYYSNLKNIKLNLAKKDISIKMWEFWN